MKSSIMRLLCLALILSFSAACGKKESSGGSGSSFNPLTSNPNLSQASVEAYNSLRVWYDGATENGNIGSFGEFLKTTDTVSNGFSGSFSLCILGMGINCNSVQPNGCYFKNANATFSVGTPKILNGIPTECTPVVASYTKAGNAELVKAISGNGLILSNASRSGSVYTLEYGEQNSYGSYGNVNTPKVIYLIDTDIHSLLNPVMIKEQSKQTVLKGYRVIR